MVTNSTGGVVEYTDYDAYGNILEGGTVSRFDMEHKEYDSLVGDYDYHFRKMKPEWGIFLQPDQLVIPKPYSPQSLNRYMFELGNPGTNIDPDGKESFYIGGGLTEGFSIGMGKGDGLSFKGNVFSGYTISTYDRDSNGGATPQAEASLEFGWSLSDKGFAGESTDYSLEVGFIRKGGITLSVPKYGNIQSKIAGSSIGGSIGRGLEVPVQGSKMDSTTKDTKIGQIPGLFDIAKVATAAYGKAAAAKQSVINRLAKVYGFKKASGSKK